MKLAVVSGASSGIGAACARALAAAGVDLILLARRRERLDELARALSVRVDPHVVDVRDPAAVSALVAAIGDRPVDVLVNNAGLARGTAPIQAGELADWDAMIDTNLKGLLYLTRGLLPGMVRRGRGHVVNIGSIAGRQVYPGGGVYCATKFAVRALTEGMRMDLMGTPVRVTNVAPGMVETEFSNVRLGNDEAARAVYERMTPLRDEDVAETVLWCLSRPAQVNVQELVLYPTDQAGVGLVARRP